MAGKAKSCYLSIVDSKTHKTVFRKMFFTMGDLRKFRKDDPKMQEYPETEYHVVVETY